MSESKSTKTEKTRATKTPRARKSTSRAAAPPWVEGGIDYGPAILAIDELVSWAFDLADKNVADWPAARRRVKNARCIVRASIAGKRSGPVPHDDVVFTASLLVRILDADLGLGLADVMTVLEEMGLPTEEAAPVARRARATAAPKRQPPAVVVPAPEPASPSDVERLSHYFEIMATLTPAEVAIVKQSTDRLRPTEHDALVSMLYGLTVEQSIAWIRAVLIPSAPTPIAMGRREPRVVVAPMRPVCVGCPAASGFRRAA